VSVIDIRNNAAADVFSSTSCYTSLSLLFFHFYVGRLQSSWTHLITPSRNFVEVR
jgi:hypothetical protein